MPIIFGEFYYVKVSVQTTLSCQYGMQLLYKSQPSSQKDSPRTSDCLPPTMARQEKSLAVCLEILQDYTAKDFSLFAVLTTADFYSHNSQFHFLSHNPNDMKQWHATLSCLSSTAWGKVLLFVGCRLTDQKKHHSLICRTILFAYSTARKKSLM